MKRSKVPHKKSQANPVKRTRVRHGAGRLVKSVRWTLEQASAEFWIARNTLSKRIKSEGILPGPDQKFSTGDICRAVFSDGEKARAALANSQREGQDLKNQILAGTLAETHLFQKVSDAMILVIREKVAQSSLPEPEKIALLREIQNINVDAIVAKQNPPADGADLAEKPAPG